MSKVNKTELFTWNKITLCQDIAKEQTILSMFTVSHSLNNIIQTKIL